MITLYIDTSSSIQIIAISKSKDYFQINKETNNNHFETLDLTTKEIMEKANIKFNQIKQVVVCNGPGSFIGTRIGVTFAKTIAYLNNANIYTINSLSLLDHKNAFIKYRRDLLINKKLELKKISEIQNEIVSYKNSKIKYKKIKEIIPTFENKEKYFKKENIKDIVEIQIRKSDAENNKILKKFKLVENSKIPNLEKNIYFKNSKNISIIYKKENIGFVIFNESQDFIEIYYIYINKLNRNFGLATRLLNELEKLNKKIILEVNKNNYSAINFYLKNNFKEISIRKKYYKNGDDAILMEKSNEFMNSK